MVGELEETSEVFPLIQQAFSEKYKVCYQKDIDAWFKTHYVWIIPMNSVYYLFDNDLKKVSNDKYAMKRMIDATAEGISVLEKLGYTITPAIQAKLVRQYRGLYNFAMKIYQRLPTSKVVAGTFHEMYALFEAFDVLKGNRPRFLLLLGIA